MDYDWSDFHYSAQIKVTIVGLFQLYEDIPAFKNHLRDFLVEIKVVNIVCLGPVSYSVDAH